eukprot:m.18904 g.18904  ORF g.18904 m.18904 type:complete len:324 (+) comp5814_c0_seq1:76-1047(+)
MVSCAALVFAALVATTAASDASLNFLVIGDWGGSGTYPYTTAGELATSKAMNEIAPKVNSSFILALGDNFYSEGVKSEYDTRFKYTFENVFYQESLQTPWYVLAGNHDHYGNVTAQIAYAKHSKRWNFDSEYYTFTKNIPTADGSNSNATIQFVFVDTVLLAGGTDHVTGELLEVEDQTVADTQWQWIEDTLKASTADYLVVAGHYPVWSICEHGPTSALVQRLKPLLEQYNANTYFCGHDHCAEHIVDGNVNYHVIGAAHFCDHSTAHKNAVPKDSLKFHWAEGQGAFAHVQVNTKEMVITHYSDEPKALYSATMHPRTKRL